MTTTSTGTNTFPVRYIVIAAVVTAALVAMTFAISQQTGTKDQQAISSPIQASAVPSDVGAETIGLFEALASGKFDAGLVPSASPAGVQSNPGPEPIEVTGQGGLYDALIAEKFGMDYSWHSPIDRYVRGPEVEASGLTKALAEGKLDEAPANNPDPSVSKPAVETVTVTGEGSSYEALIAGKFGMDYLWSNPNVRYVRGSQAVQSGLWAALAAGKLDAGKLDDSSMDTRSSTPATYTPIMSGGHQQ